MPFDFAQGIKMETLVPVDTMKTRLLLFTVRTPAGTPPAIFADLSGDSTSGFDFTPIQQFNISLSRFHVFEDLDTRLPICTGTPLLVSKPDSSIACEMRSKLGKVTLLNYVPKNYRTAHSALRARGRFGHAIIGPASWIAPT